MGRADDVPPTADTRREQGTHRRTVYNDNQDGTLSEIGKYDRDAKANPPYIGLIGPPGPADPPARPMRVHVASHRRPRTPSPSAPESRGGQASSACVRRSGRRSAALRRAAAPASPGPPEVPFAGSALWDHLVPLLSLGDQSPGRALHRELLTLPRQRDVPLRWRQKLGGFGSSPSDTKQFAALLIYLTGTPVDCSNCHQAARNRSAELPFELCVALPANVSEALRESPEACVCCNCLLVGSSRSCSFVRPRPAQGASAPEEFGAVPGGAAALLGDPAADEVNISSIHRISDREPSVRAGPSRAAMKAPETSEVARSQAFTHPPSLNPYTVEVWEADPGSLITPARQGSGRESLHPALGPSQTAAPDPGHLLTRAVSVVAFSGALVAEQSVQLADGITAQDWTIKPGGRTELRASAGIQVCQVLRGKARVTLPAGSFYVSVAGRFVLDSTSAAEDETVVIENKFATDDVILSVCRIRR